MRTMRAVWVLIGLACACAAPAAAQGIDCTKARSPTEKAICASPALLALDHNIAVAYADALARQPDRAAALRQELIGWLRQRDKACTVQAAALTACLTSQLTDRLAALAPPGQVAAASPVGLPLVQPAAAAPPADPAIPAGISQPAAAGRLDATSLPAAEQGETLLHVTSPGRFAIAAHSPAGTALQLVDMLTGPTDVAGVAGAQDGRLDELLDIGTYKIRLFSAPGATGAVTLSLTAFHDAAAPAALPQPGRLLAASLRDAEQRAFWLAVPPAGPGGNNVRIEAAGRALADLRLWRDGRELADLTPEARRIEPVPGHAMTDLRLVGRVEPGTYLAVAYGGPALPWTDNDTAQPFNLRGGASAVLAAGWAGGAIGPFGSAVFALPAGSGTLRLDLPAPATADLLAGGASAAIAKNSREATARVAYVSKGDDVVEVRGAAGQDFTLRMIGPTGATRLAIPGTWFVTAVTAGLGGDEPPPALLLQRTADPRQPPAIVASTVPQVGTGRGWHARFNLRGETRLLFQSPAGGEITTRSTGTDVTTLRDEGTLTSLPPGMFFLTLRPKPDAQGANAQGILDLVVGPPGLTPPPLPPWPADPVIPLGVQTIARGQALALLGDSGPAIGLGLAARRVPVALAEGPLTVTLAAGAGLDVPVEVAPGGEAALSEVGVGPVAFGRRADAGGMTMVIPPADHARTVALLWRRAVTGLPPIPAPPPPDRTASLAAGTPAFFDLARSEERGFTLTVADGGLYRIETLGRLHTSGRLATPFIPHLVEAEGNGAGDNMLIQTMLRAGRYRVEVAAVDSAGHLGLVAAPAPLLAGATLLPGGSVRASLPAGTGVGFPVEIAGEAPRYRLAVDSLGAPWTGRLEDADGWPITTPGPLDGTEEALRPGHYRLLVSPDAVTRDVVARLIPLPKPVETTGHGPHDLPFAAPQTATWREPEGADQPRTPDQWRFALFGEAHATLRLDDTMVGELTRSGASEPPTRVVGTLDTTLAAGAYVLAVTSLGRNDRLVYKVSLDSEELQPDRPRAVALPAQVPFAIAAPRVVSLTSFGGQPVRAVLRRADGSIVGRYGARQDDWNIAVSRRLPAGRYRLDLASAAPPDPSSVAAAPLPSYGSAPAATDDDAGNDDDNDAPPPARNGQAPQTKATRPDAGDDDASNDAAPADSDRPAPSVTLRLALPASLPAAAAPTEAAILPGRGVHELTLPPPAPGTLLVAQATAPAALVLALERQDGDGWRTVALADGRAPVLASPADAQGAAWRLEAWAVDGGPEPITLAARAVPATAQPAGRIHLAALAGMPGPLAVATVTLPAPGLLRVADAPAGLLAGGWPGHALAAPHGGRVVLAGREAWLVASQAGDLTAEIATPDPGSPVPLALPAGMVAPLPELAAAAGHVAVWQAESGQGQPGLGGAMGVADSSALALGGGPVSLRRADADDDLDLRLTRLEPALSAAIALDGPLHRALRPGEALPVTLPPGDKRLALDLPAGTAAVAGWRAPNPLVTWAGPAPLSRSIAGGWTEVLLLNTGAAPAPVALSWQAEPATPPLPAGGLVKRFFGAAGSFELPVAASRLGVAGNADLTLIGADGTVQRGQALTARGPGRLVVRHGVGPIALWSEADGISPWPAPPPQPTGLPAHLALTGPAMALALTGDRPVLLHAVTTAPVLIGLGSAAPDLFAAGAAFHHMLPAGGGTLRLISPTDGPLSGTLDLAAEPMIAIGEGLGEPVSVAPGGAALFGFTLAKAATIGVGVRADPDRATVRLLDASGKVIGAGVAQLRALPAGAYFVEAQVAPDAPPTTIRPAVIGITPRGNGPPPDVVHDYLVLVGMKPQGESQ